MDGITTNQIAATFVQRATAEVGADADAGLLRLHVRSLILDWWEGTPGLTAGEARQVLAIARNAFDERFTVQAQAQPLAAA